MSNLDLPVQVDLIPSDQLPADALSVLESGRNPQFTARRFFAQYPDKYRLAATLLAEGISCRQVARVLKCSTNTVTAIDREESRSRTVETLKRDAVSRYRTINRLSSERLLEILEDPESDVDLKSLAVVLGITQDKIELLEGRPTSRVESGDVPLSRERLAETLEAIRDAYQESGQTGMEAETRGQKEEFNPAAAVLAAEVGAPVYDAPTDSVSAGDADLSNDSDDLCGGAVNSDDKSGPAGGD